MTSQTETKDTGLSRPMRSMFFFISNGIFVISWVLFATHMAQK